MRGIVLAGGSGSRLNPLTKITNKHLLPVYNRPMIDYPLQTLASLGCTDVLVVTGGEHIGDFARYLGDGSQHNVKLTYRVQTEAGGIAQALACSEGFIQDGETFPVILGDNIFAKQFRISDVQEPSLFLKKVKDPERFGVYYDGSIIEKPKNPKSDLAVVGLYVYDSTVFNFIKTLKPSDRGELEITSINNWYLKKGIRLITLKRFWSDAGTFESLHKSAKYIQMCKHIADKSKGRKAWNKNKTWGKDVKNKIATANRGRRYPKSVNKKKGRPKDANPNWKGGVSTENHLIRTSPEYKDWRLAVFARDCYTCTSCGQIGGKLNADHILRFSEHPNLRLNIDNGRTLCEFCHRKTDTYGRKRELYHDKTLEGN